VTARFQGHSPGVPPRVARALRGSRKNSGPGEKGGVAEAGRFHVAGRDGAGEVGQGSTVPGHVPDEGHAALEDLEQAFFNAVARSQPLDRSDMDVRVDEAGMTNFPATSSVAAPAEGLLARRKVVDEDAIFNDQRAPGPEFSAAAVEDGSVLKDQAIRLFALRFLPEVPGGIAREAAARDAVAMQIPMIAAGNVIAFFVMAHLHDGI